MPGAGGSKAIIFTYNIMAKNGYNMVVPLDNSVSNELMRPEKMKFKTNKFN